MCSAAMPLIASGFEIMNLEKRTKRFGPNVGQLSDSMQTLNDICKNPNYIATKGRALPAIKVQ
jgi:hypothetical protein